jgi:FKBP-type peptidyl-prolyl cis-trans isomerase
MILTRACLFIFSRLVLFRRRRRTSQVGVGQVIRGWDEELPQMSKGQIVHLVCPPHYAYGVRGYPPVIPPNATLIFEIELISFTSA